jgi:GDP-4-dehydro-6-deoxy-D-mannose reductase
VLITGIEGFVGHHLAAHLVRQNAEVHGTYIMDSGCEGLPEGVCLRRVDLTHPDLIGRSVAECGPDEVYHLAAQSSAALSFRDPGMTFEVNVLGWINLLESVRQLRIKPRMLLVGSSEVYGAVPESELPVVESRPPSPTSPYGISKATQEMLARHYGATHGIPIVTVRPFPHTGPGQTDAFALPSFARQLAEIEAGTREPVIRVGDLSVRRDLLDVRDVVEAYALTLRSGEAGDVYNVCSGRAHSMQDMLGMLISLSTVEVRVEPDPERLRPADIPVLLGNPEKLARKTGWEPRRGLEDALRDLLEDCRKKVGVCESSSRLSPSANRRSRDRWCEDQEPAGDPG